MILAVTLGYTHQLYQEIQDTNPCTEPLMLQSDIAKRSYCSHSTAECVHGCVMYLLLPVNSTTALIEPKMALVVNQCSDTKVGFRPHGALSHFEVHALCLLHYLQEVSNESIKGKVPVCKLTFLEQNMRLENGRFQGGGERVPALSEGWCVVLAPGDLEGLACVGASTGRSKCLYPSIAHSVAEL